MALVIFAAVIKIQPNALLAIMNAGQPAHLLTLGITAAQLQVLLVTDVKKGALETRKQTILAMLVDVDLIKQPHNTED